MSLDIKDHHIRTFNLTTRAGVKYQLTAEAGGSVVSIHIGNQAVALMPEDMAAHDEALQQAEAWRLNGLKELSNGQANRTIPRYRDTDPD